MDGAAQKSSIEASVLARRGPAAIGEEAQPSSRQRQQRKRGRLGHDRDRERSPRDVFIHEILIGDCPGTRISSCREERVNPREGASNRKGDVRDRIGAGRYKCQRIRRPTQIIARSKHTGIYAVHHGETELIWPPRLVWIIERRKGFCRDVEKTLRPTSRFQPIGEPVRTIAGEGERGINSKCIVLIEYRPAGGKRQCLGVLRKGSSGRHHSADDCCDE
jgi:hypothetical protein